MQVSNVQPILKIIPKFKGVSLIVRLISSTLIAMCCIMFMPLSALACGGFFSADTPVDQNIERIIFTVDPGSTSVYEQINYTGSASNFAWVLPVPAVPKVSTASINLFRDLDEQTVPRFFYSSPPPCGLAPLGGEGEFAGAPAPGGNVNVYGKGTAGPYAYDVIGTSNPGALTLWLQTHHYHVPDQLPSSIQPYIQAHMLFLAMRLQPQAGIQDITPVKITYPTTQSQVMIPLRMATFAAMPHMGCWSGFLAQAASRHRITSLSTFPMKSLPMLTIQTCSISRSANLMDTHLLLNMLNLLATFLSATVLLSMI